METVGNANFCISDSPLVQKREKGYMAGISNMDPAAARATELTGFSEKESKGVK